MLMTRESDYAVRILRALDSGRKMTVTQICEEENVPVPFAYKILKKLSNGGFVDICRGADGGCRLVVDLDEVSLYDLLNCMNDSIIINACMKPGYVCERKGGDGEPCHFHENLKKVQRVFERELKKRSIGEMIR